MLTLVARVTTSGAGAQTPFSNTDFVRVRAGTFQMGDRVRVPVHAVTLTHEFWIQKTPVTQQQWLAVMERNPSLHYNCPMCPVENVSYDQVMAYINELNRRTPGMGYRLPTEAEWEYAARAGTTGDYGTPGAIVLGGWIADNSDDRTHPVAELRPNGWGLYDMEGNVWERVSDWYGPYPSAAITDPTGPSVQQSTAGRACRGGSYNNIAPDAWSAFRGFCDPALSGGDIGFRLVRSR